MFAQTFRASKAFTTFVVCVSIFYGLRIHCSRSSSCLCFRCFLVTGNRAAIVLRYMMDNGKTLRDIWGEAAIHALSIFCGGLLQSTLH